MKSGSSAVGAALLLLVAITHYGYDPLASYFFPEEQQRAARAIFYVLRGVEATALYGLLWSFAPRRLPIVAACVWGAVESAQTAVCRLAFGLGGPAPAPGPYAGLCDVAAGYPVGLVMAVVGLACAFVVQECLGGRRHRAPRG